MATPALGPRAWHTGQFTGTQMIIWGGLDAKYLTYYKDGGRYCYHHRPIFTLTCSPNTFTLPLGSADSATCSLQSMFNYSGTVSLTCENVPSDVSCSISPSVVNLNAGTTQNVTVDLSVGTNSQWGIYALKVKATDGDLTVRETLSLTIPQPTFTFSCSPDTIQTAQNSTVDLTCSATSVNGFSGNVTPMCEYLPDDLTCSYNPAVLNIPFNGSTSTTLTLTTLELPEGVYYPQASATDGSLKAGQTLQIEVEPAFIIDCVPPSLDLMAKNVKTNTCTFTASSGFNGTMSILCDHTISGLTCTPDQTNINLTPSASIPVDITLSTGTSPELKPANVHIKGTSWNQMNRFILPVRILTPSGFTPENLAVDINPPGGGTGNLNTILEPGETVPLVPSWHLAGTVSSTLNGTLSSQDSALTLVDTTANYGLVPPDTSVDCISTGDCYQIPLSETQPRPSTHWDISVDLSLNMTLNP